MHLCEKNSDSWLKYYYYGWLDHIFGASDQSICEKKILHHVKCQTGTGTERIKVTVVFKIVFLLRSSHG